MKGKRKSTKKQKVEQKSFSDAMTRYRMIRKDPVKLEDYARKCPPTRNLHNFILSEVRKEMVKGER